MKRIYEINFDDGYIDSAGNFEGSCVRVVDYKNKQVLKKLINPDKIITTSKGIAIKFDYPLTNSATFIFTREDGFTRKDFFKAIYEGYDYIYLSEKDPGIIPGTCNRTYSEGQFGIWGHVIKDLFIEGVVKINRNTFELLIGS